MTKTEAINLFGKTMMPLAKALGVTKAAIGNWPEELTQNLEDRVIGAYVRNKGTVPQRRIYTGKPVKLPRKR